MLTLCVAIITGSVVAAGFLWRMLDDIESDADTPDIIDTAW